MEFFHCQSLGMALHLQNGDMGNHGRVRVEGPTRRLQGGARCRAASLMTQPSCSVRACVQQQEVKAVCHTAFTVTHAREFICCPQHTYKVLF